MKNKKEDVTAEKFTKQKILNSEKYIKHKDMLTAILEENNIYTKEEIEKKINEFLRRRI